MTDDYDALMDDAAVKARLLVELDALVRKRDRLRGNLDELDEQIRAAVVTGAGVGIPKLTLSQRAKVSRQTVYDILEAAKGGETT